MLVRSNDVVQVLTKKIFLVKISTIIKRVLKSRKKEGKMKVIPLYDRVLLKRLEEKEVKKGGIIIPDTAKEKPQEAIVKAVGKGKVLEDGKVVPLEVKEGDKVLIGKYAGTEIKIEDEEYVIVREDEILAKITD